MNLLHPLFFLLVCAPLPRLLRSDDSLPKSCDPRSCSGSEDAVHFSYPFWISGQQPSYCGESAFEIHCDGNRPILTISGKKFTVDDLSYSDNSILLVDDIAYEDSCGLPLSNVSMDGTPFDVASNNYYLYIYNNCTSPPLGLIFNKVPCATDSSLHSFALFYSELALGNYGCRSVIAAPVDVGASVTDVMTMSSIDIVKIGFLVNWTANIRNDRGIGKKIGIGVGVGAGFVSLMSAVFFVLYTRRRKKYSRASIVSRSIQSMHSSRIDFEKGGSSYGVPIFDYNELAKATNNFDPAMELGDGGFGTVFKGKLRDGRMVAVKQLYKQNHKRFEQFVNEVDILARLRHPNLISLYGCTSRQSSRLLLVYEYISNGTVTDHIHGDLAKPGLPPWSTRLSIAIETASALVYLHSSKVIHRDLKTNNILLDDNFTVKVADFGLSRLFPLDVTHISTAPQGTPGYVDPEYHQCYQLTEKSDVFSFGVVLIELISSLPAVDIMRHRHEINLSSLALNKIQANALHELVDANLGFQSDELTREMITAVAELAFQCLQPQHEERPSMQEALETLKMIQKFQRNDEKAEVVVDLSDEAVLLKSNPLMLSPDSVAVKWVSTSTASNASL